MTARRAGPTRSDRTRGGLTPLGEPLDRVLRHLRAPAARTVKTVLEQWPEIAGPSVAANAAAVALHDGELVLEVQDPAWASELRWLHDVLIQRIEERVGPGRVQRIRVRVKRHDQT